MTYSGGAHTDALQRAVDTLATRLGRSVAVDDTHGRLVVSSRHFGDEDPLRTYAVLQRSSDPRVMAHFQAHDIYRWTGPGRIPASDEMEFKARVCCPVRAHGVPFGHLFLIDEDVQPWEVDRAVATAAEIGTLMYRRLVLHEQDHDRRETVVRELIGADPEARAIAHRTLVTDELVAPTDPVSALSVRLSASATRAADPETALRRAVERLDRGRHAGRLLASVRGRHGTVLLVGEPTADAVRVLARELQEDLARAEGVDRAIVGLGRGEVGTDAARRSHEEARRVADAAALLPELGDVVGHDDLGVYAVLLAVPRRDLTPELCPDALRRLVELEGVEVLVETLETYLDCCGDATRTATALRVHRSTLYYRLGRVEAITGSDLRDGGQRLALHLGLKLWRTLAAYRDVAPDDDPG